MDKEIEMVSFVTQKLLDRAAVAILLKHGCTICQHGTYSDITFPEGTLKEEVWPRVRGDIYDLRLPDGYVCMAQYAAYLNQYVISYQPEKEQSLNH